MFGEGLTDLIAASGLWVIAATVFIECGFFGGFFLPGDSLLFLAGFLAAEGVNNIVVTIVVILTAAILGNCLGYFIGTKAGPKLFTKEDSIFFNKSYILRAQQFYEKHGGKTLILARFVPILRTFAPLVAGIGTMTFRRFFVFSTVGAILWAVFVPLTGYYIFKFIGHEVDISKYMEVIFLAIIAVSIASPILHGIREKRKQKVHVSSAQLRAEQAKIADQIKS
jgi:membrane-associated protein